jgi:hypothetical protein
MPPGKDNDTVLISIFMALEGLFAYSAFLPSIMTVGTFVDSSEKVTMIRQGEIVGTFFLIVLAIMTARITKSAWPMVMGVAAGIVALGIYEFSLRQSPAWKNGQGQGVTIHL